MKWTKPAKAWISRSSKRVAGGLAHPSELLVGRRDVHVRCVRRVVRRAAAQVGVDADDVGLARREGQHLATAATDDDRRVGALRRLGLPVEISDPVVLAGERERPVGHQPLQHRDRLCEPRDPHPGWVEPETALLVVVGHPPRADAELEPPVRQQVDRRRLVGQHHRVLVVVAEDERADAQVLGHRGDRRDAGDRREGMVDEVVGHVGVEYPRSSARRTVSRRSAPDAASSTITPKRNFRSCATAADASGRSRRSRRSTRSRTCRGWSLRARRPHAIPGARHAGRRAARCGRPGARRTARSGRCSRAAP